MNILVDHTLINYAKPAVYAGFSASRHDPKMKSTFDTFDMVNPDLYIADSNLLNNTVFKNIEERPALKVCVIQKGQVESPIKEEFTNRFGDVYPWIVDLGYADLFDFAKSQYVPKYKSDIVSIEDDITAILESINLPFSINFKIFSSKKINSNNYCGYISQQNKKYAYASSKCSIAVEDNIYNSILCNCFPIMFGSSILDQINTDYTNQLKELKEEVIQSKTYFNALSSVLDIFGLSKESSIILNKAKELL